MNQYRKFLTGLSIIVLSGQAVRPQTPETSPVPDVEGNLKLFESWVSTRIAFGELPSVAVGIVYGDQLVYANGFGDAVIGSSTSATSETIYRVGSISKLFSAIAVLQLRDRGLLALDDAVSQHLDWFGEAHLSADARRVTIRHLLTHTSGLRFEAGAPGYGYWQSSDFPSSEEIITAAAEIDLVVPPDTTFKYSNYGFVLLGEIVESVSGIPYEDYVQQQIFDPLRMGSSSFSSQDRLSDHLARGYGRKLGGTNRREFETVNANALNAAGGMFSSVDDLGKFLGWQLRLAAGDGDSDILAGRTLQEMQRVSWLSSNWLAARGLGFEIVHGPNRDLIGHSGLFPGFQSVAYVSPTENVGVIVLANAFTSPLFSEVMEIRDRAFDWIAPLLKRTNGNVTTRLAPEEWSALEGVFRFLERDFLILVIDGQLRMFDPSAADPKAGFANLVPVSRDTFRIEGGEPKGEQVVFERTRTGRVIALHIADWGRAARTDMDSPPFVE